jgi:hypothetical protein
MIRKLSNLPLPTWGGMDTPGDLGFYECCDYFVDGEGILVEDLAEFLEMCERDNIKDISWTQLDGAIYIWAGDEVYVRGRIADPDAPSNLTY